MLSLKQTLTLKMLGSESELANSNIVSFSARTPQLKQDESSERYDLLRSGMFYLFNNIG